MCGLRAYYRFRVVRARAKARSSWRDIAIEPPPSTDATATKAQRGSKADDMRPWPRRAAMTPAVASENPVSAFRMMITYRPLAHGG